MSMLLAIHITSALLTIFICIYAWYKPSKSLHLPLNYASIFSILTGIIVSLGEPLTFGVCAKLGIYLAMILMTKYMLARSIKQYSGNA